MSVTNYYSLRCLSPYQGTVQVVETTGCRAMSSDGVTWRVQFLNLRSRVSGYALWRADGTGNLIETDRTRSFIEALQNHPTLPFPFLDKLELWLLDAKEQKPLAILASTLSCITPPRDANTVWQVALAGDESFVAPCLRSHNPQPAAVSPISHYAVLSRCVQKAAGPHERAQWFRRDSAGNGIGLTGCRIDASQRGRELQPNVFPELLLREDWETEMEGELVRDYHDWHAPNLLTHGDITHATRDRLERAACRQAEKLYKVRHLLPETINTGLLKVALVEAVIRRSV